MAGHLTSAIVAADVPTAVLVIGIVGLVTTTAASSLALPSAGRRRRWRRSRSVLPPVHQRRVITGRPAALPAVSSTPARQTTTAPDDRVATDLRAAEALIDRLLDHHPEQLAHMLTTWINADADADADLEPARPAVLRRPLPAEPERDPAVATAPPHSDVLATATVSIDDPSVVTPTVETATIEERS